MGSVPPSAPKSDPPINLDGKVKLRTSTLIAIAIALFTLAGAYWRLPSTDDIKNLFESHNDSRDAHPRFTNSLIDVRRRTERIEVQTGLLQQAQNDTHDDINYIRERVDYLTEQTVRRSARNEALQRTTPGRARRAGDKAVDNLRGGTPPAAAVTDAVTDAVKDSLDGL